MINEYGERFKVIKDFGGETLRLTLVKKQDYEDKEYSLYMVCKVRKNEDGKDEYIPLYPETFTPRQVEKFYKNPTYYEAVIQDSEETCEIIENIKNVE